jgi:hypothetical protein
MTTMTSTLPCLSCGTDMELDEVQVQAALMTMPEGCYCGECSDRLRAAPSFEAWATDEWARQQQRYRDHQAKGDDQP